MADQNIEAHDDPSIQPPDDKAGAGQRRNGNGAADDDGELDVEALKAELERERRAKGQLLNEKKKREKQEAEKQRLVDMLRAHNEVLEEYGVKEPDELREVLKAREEASDKQARDKGEVDKIVQNLESRRQRDLAKKDEQIAEREKRIESLIGTIDALTVDAQLDAELSKIVDPALKRGAFALHRPKVRAVEDDEAPYGRRVVVAVGDDEMSVRDYLKQWAESDLEAQPYLIGNRSTGGGAPATTGPGGRIPRMKRSQMSAKQKSDFITEHGLDKYNALPLN